MKIYHKDSWGFWIFRRFSLYVEDAEGNLTEVLVDRKTWNSSDAGDKYVP